MSAANIYSSDARLGGLWFFLGVYFSFSAAVSSHIYTFYCVTAVRIQILVTTGIKATTLAVLVPRSEPTSLIFSCSSTKCISVKLGQNAVNAFRMQEAAREIDACILMYPLFLWSNREVRHFFFGPLSHMGADIKSEWASQKYLNLIN